MVAVAVPFAFKKCNNPDSAALENFVTPILISYTYCSPPLALKFGTATCNISLHGVSNFIAPESYPATILLLVRAGWYQPGRQLLLFYRPNISGSLPSVANT